MKHLKTLMTAGATACLMIAPLASAHESGSDEGPRIEKSYDFTGFNRIEVEGVYGVEIEVGPGFSIEASGSEKRMKDSEIKLSGDTLVLGTRDHKRNRSYSGKNNGVTVIITMPELDAISLAGVGSVEADGIEAGEFDVKLEGVGSVELSGTCETLTAKLEGVGSLDARDLKCANVDVDVEGMGSAEVYASASVDADMDGIGSIEVWGKPDSVKKSKSRMSSIDIK